MLFSSIRSDNAKYNAEMEQREAEQEAEEEIDERANAIWDTNTSVSRAQAREMVISSILAEEQRRKDFWHSVINAGRIPADPWE